MKPRRDIFPQDIHVFGSSFRDKGTKYVTVLPNDSALEIFSSIQNWEIKDQISIALRIFDDRADPLFNMIQNDANNKKHGEYINTVKQQIYSMSQPVKGLLQVEVIAFMNIFINNNHQFLGSDSIIEGLVGEITTIPSDIERLKFQRKKDKNLHIDDIDDYSNEITDLKQYKKFLLAAHHRMTQNPDSKKSLENKDTPQTFEDLFYNPKHADICLSILNRLEPPFIDSFNNYIGKNKGIFPLWIGVLKAQKLIKRLHDKEYSRILNDKINGLRLTEDGSEFRKVYARLTNNKIDLDIKTILSQFSQEGKLGK